MDEMDKYKQRQEAIAEKRRLQEEQDKARREMEDEKIRLQQLKRKSLRDQWLMEGAPLSPTSMDAQGPGSPLWGSTAQDIQEHIDKFPSERQQLAEAEKKLLNEQMDDGQAEAVKVTEARAEIVQDAVMQNGENNATGLETAEVSANQGLAVDETACVVTNGRGDEAATNQNHQWATNGPLLASQGGVSVDLEPALTQGLSGAEPCHVPNVNTEKEEEEEEEEEEDEGTVVMRAERVILTDEGDHTPDELTPPEARQESERPEEETLPPHPEGAEAAEEEKEEKEEEEEVLKTELPPEIHTEPEEGETTAPDAGVQSAHTETQDDVDVNGKAETEVEARGEQREERGGGPAEERASPVSPLPVYSDIQSSSVVTSEGEYEAQGSPEESSEVASEAPGPGVFQEVPLVDPQEDKSTAGAEAEAEPGEQQPLLLSQAKEPAAAVLAKSPAGPETHSPSRAGQGEEAPAAPKRKTCQCCSVM